MVSVSFASSRRREKLLVSKKNLLIGYTSAPASISAAAVRWVLDVVLENLKQPVSVEIATYRHSAIRFVNGHAEFQQDCMNDLAAGSLVRFDKLRAGE